MAVARTAVAVGDELGLDATIGDGVAAGAALGDAQLTITNAIAAAHSRRVTTAAFASRAARARRCRRAAPDRSARSTGRRGREPCWCSAARPRHIRGRPAVAPSRAGL